MYERDNYNEQKISSDYSIFQRKLLYRPGCEQGRSYVISYVARKLPFSLGRRGLASCACSRRHTSRFSDKFSSLCHANAVSNNVCAAPHALIQTNIADIQLAIAVN